jgi:hypothetical protein
MLRDVAGIEPVVSGTDYRYLHRDLAVSCRDHIEAAPHSPTASGRPSSAPRARR